MSGSLRRVTIAATVALLLPSLAAAQAPAAPAPIPASTPLGSGPHLAVMEADPGLTTHTVYRPADLGALGAAKLPIVVWGNGACVNTGNRFRWFLTEIASYGYLVVANGPIGPAEMETAPRPQPAGLAVPPRGPRTYPPAPTKSSQLIDAIDWALAENARPQSRYFGKLDAKKIAVMGQSCGGVQAIEASADPRVATTVVWNSGLFPEPTGMAGGKMMSKADLALLHAPVAYISGDQQDQALPNADDDFEKISKTPVFRAWERGVPHGGTYREPGGGEFGGVGVAWLNWQLKGDARSAKMFTGPDCGLCVNPRWVVRRKGIR